MLAGRAIKGIPSTNPQISNARATTRTRFPRLLKNITAMDGLSFASKQISLCTPQGNPFSQDFPNCSVQARQFIYSQRTSRAAWINSSQPHTFIGIAIAQPGKDALIQQHRLKYSTALRELSGEYIN